jgi:hypothetical protein
MVTTVLTELGSPAQTSAFDTVNLVTDRGNPG